MESPSPTQSPASPQTATSRVTAVLWLILILATFYICYFTHLDAVGLVGPDEPRYAWIARDMAESGDFITPRLYGKPWFEKPPLYYWSAAVSFKLFGVSETSARLPSAIFALLATLATAWLAWRIYNVETARWLLLLLPATVAMISFSHAAATDMPFAATLTLAMVTATNLLGLIPESQTAPRITTRTSLPSPTVLTSVLFGFTLGLATLAKGPAALILTGGAIALWALFTKRWRDTLRPLHPAAIAAFCATAFPWYILCAIRNPDFLRVFIIEHNFKRFLTPEFQHVQPFWFYAEILLLAFLPWIAALLWALVTGISRVRPTKRSASTIFLLCWAVFCIGFFTISRSKLPGYILPTVPPIALLLARSCTFTEQKRQRRWLAFASLIVAMLSAVLFLSLWNQPDRYLKHSSAFAPLFYLALFMLAFSNLFFALGFFFSRRTAALWTAILPILAGLQIFETFSPFTPLSIQSPRYMAQQIAAEQIPLSVLRVAKIKRATLYGLNFYLRTDLQEWDGDASREVYVLTPEQAPPTCWQQQKEINCASLWEEPEKIGDLQLQHLKPK